MKRTPEICCDNCIWSDTRNKQLFCHFYAPSLNNEARFIVVQPKIHWCSNFISKDDGRSALDIMEDESLEETLNIKEKINGN